MTKRSIEVLHQEVQGRLCGRDMTIKADGQSGGVKRWAVKHRVYDAGGLHEISCMPEPDLQAYVAMELKKGTVTRLYVSAEDWLTISLLFTGQTLKIESSVA